MRCVLAISLLAITVLLGACSDSGTINTQGYIEGEYIYMASPAAGELFELSVERGQWVDAGDALFTLNPQPEQSAASAAEYALQSARAMLSDSKKGMRPSELEALEAQLLKTEAELHLAELTYQRNERLFKTQTVQEQQLDESRAAFIAAKEQMDKVSADIVTAKLGKREDEIAAQEAKVSQAEAEYQQATWWLDEKTVTAPKTSQVVDTYYLAGEQIPATRPVLSLLAPEDKYVIFFIPEGRLSQIALGNAITVNCDGCKQAYKANIAYISPLAEYTPPVIYSRDVRDKLVYLIRARFTPDVAKHFHPGQPVDIRIN